MKAAAVLVGDRFIVRRRCCGRSGNRIDHYLEQVSHGVELARVELIEETVSLFQIHIVFDPAAQKTETAVL